MPLFVCLFVCFQGVGGALTVLMKETIKPNLMQTLEVSKRESSWNTCFVTITFLSSVNFENSSRPSNWKAMKEDG